jgi:hypothetical protein
MFIKQHTPRINNNAVGFGLPRTVSRKEHVKGMTYCEMLRESGIIKYGEEFMHPQNAWI